MISYRSYSHGKVYEFKKGKEIGGGAFGKVGEVLGRPEYVYKEISLNSKPGDRVMGGYDLRVKSLNRELWALKKLNQLEGYIHDKEKGIITLIMKKQQGTPEKEGEPNPNFDPQNPASVPNIILYNDFNQDRAAATAKGLRELNYRGIYHLDPNPANSLIEEKDGKLKANIIDFGLAMEFSYLGTWLQWVVFDISRPFTHSSWIQLPERPFNLFYGQKIQAAKKEVDDQHKLAYYATLGFYAVAGIGVVSVCGLNSLLLWQFVRSYLIQSLLIELRAILDVMDNLYSKAATDDNAKHQLRARKMLINLGYVLINVYTLRSLYVHVPNLQIINNLSNCIETIRNCDNGTLTQLASNLINEGMMPALTKISELIKAQDFVGLDELLADVTYLYMQIGMSVKSLVNTIEKAPPVNCLLMQVDLAYQYNPILLFRYAKTRTKEWFTGQPIDPIDPTMQEQPVNKLAT